MDYSSWAILNSSGDPVCAYDGIASCTVTEGSQVLTEPLENGEVAAFNKVRSPDSVQLQLIISQDKTTQEAALSDLRSLKSAVGEESLCTLVTPFFVIDNLALEAIGQSRTSDQNANLLVVDLSFLTVKAVSAGSASVAWSPASATSSNPVNAGRVQLESTAYKATR